MIDIVDFLIKLKFLLILVMNRIHPVIAIFLCIKICPHILRIGALCTIVRQRDSNLQFLKEHPHAVAVSVRAKTNLLHFKRCICCCRNYSL